MSKRIAVWSFFATVLLMLHLLKLKSFDLSLNDDFVLGQATANGISVGKRIQQTYLLLGIGIVFCILFYQILNRFNEQFERNSLVAFADLLLQFGLVLGIIGFFNPLLIESAQFLGFLALIMLVFGRLKKVNQSLLESGSWITVGLAFITNYLLFHSAAIGGLRAIIVLLLIQFYSLNQLWVRWLCAMIISIPVIVFAGIESTLMLNQRGIFLNSYWPLLMTSTVISGALFFFYIKRNNSFNEKFIYRLLAPLSIIGIGIVQTYSPLIVQPDEAFETANILNPVMQFELFGEIPVIHNLSSHLLSDFFWIFIYRGMNGYHADASLLIYNGFTHILALLIIYFFLRTVIGNKPVVLLILFLLPAMFYFIPPYYSYVLFPVTFFFRFSKTKEQRDIIYFLLAVFAVTVWRLDLGISLIFALLVFFPFWLFYHRTESKQLIKWVAIFIGIACILGGLFILKYPSEFQQMKGYFGANQAHGLPTVGYQEINAFYLHYFALPALVVAVMLHSVAVFKKSVNKAELAILILICLFYLFNMQRGLVRHSFMENNDTQISSFAWLILAFKFWLWAREKSTLKINALTG